VVASHHHQAADQAAAVEELLLWHALPQLEHNSVSAAWGATAVAWKLPLQAGLSVDELTTSLNTACQGPLPISIALALENRDPPSPAQRQQLLSALHPWLEKPAWFRPWGKPLLLIEPLGDPQAQRLWLQRLRGLGASLLELHRWRPAPSEADGVVLLHPHGEPHLPDQASPELLALQSASYGPLGQQEHRSVWLDAAIAWPRWRAHALANTELHQHHSPGLVVLQQPPGHPLPPAPPPEPTPLARRPLQRAVVLHAYHLELVEPILQRLDALLAVEGDRSTELFVSAPESHRGALEQRLAQLPIPTHLAITANHGRDLLPFLQLLPELLARRCQLVVKLHTKRSNHVVPGSLVRVRDGEAWREGLLAGLLDPASHRQLAGQLDQARNQPYLTAPEAFLWPVEVSMGPSLPWLRQLLAERGLPLTALKGRRFPAGSMFMANHAALQWLADLQLGSTSFELESGATDGQLGHALERLLALLVQPAQAT